MPTKTTEQSASAENIIRKAITTHKIEGKAHSDFEDVFAIEPAGGGEPLRYEIVTTQPNGGAPSTLVIQFQRGPVREAGVNGISSEALLAVVRDRLERWNKGAGETPKTDGAVRRVTGAMSFLRERTLDRIQRGVEGTSAP